MSAFLPEEMFGTPWLAVNHDRRVNLARQQEGCCWYCGKAVAVFEGEWEPSPWTNVYVPKAGYLKPVLEHVIPRKRGGSSGRDNIVLACDPCNTRKSNRNLEEFRAWSSRKLGGARVIFWGERLARRCKERGELQ